MHLFSLFKCSDKTHQYPSWGLGTTTDTCAVALRSA